MYVELDDERKMSTKSKMQRAKKRVDFAEWLTYIQGKLVPLEVLDEIKKKLGDTKGISAYDIHKKIKLILVELELNVDPTYIYYNIMGAHIRPLTLEEESVILEQYNIIQSKLGNLLDNVPYIHVVHKIIRQQSLDVRVLMNFASPSKIVSYSEILARV